jgi:hypothetical protein
MAALTANYFKGAFAFSDSSPSSSKQAAPTKLLEITDPLSASVIPAGTVTINGTSPLTPDQIQKVEVSVQKYPFSGQFLYKEATTTVAYDNSSRWSIPVNFNSSGVYRILSHLIDNSGNQHWDEININVPFVLTNESNSYSHGKVARIALVNPTFTEAAYSPNAFYYFYDKYRSLPNGYKVTSKEDLSMLNGQLDEPLWIDPNTPAIVAQNKSMFGALNKDNTHILTLSKHIKRTFPNATTFVLKDEDINNGYIFHPDGRNAYDVLILSHEEYVTQQMYDNYKRFVAKGGSIIFLDGNMFYAEVKYNQDKNNITLVKGHDWMYDEGNYATKGTSERWFNENKEWVGSNYLISNIDENITFNNNPFNYTHFEENFVNNPNDKILINYRALLPANNAFAGVNVASYEKEYGKGVVLVTGLYGQKLVRDQNEKFLKFFDSLLLSALNKN